MHIWIFKIVYLSLSKIEIVVLFRPWDKTNRKYEMHHLKLCGQTG